MVQDVTSWQAATNDPLYRLVVSQVAMLPVVDMPCLGDLLSTGDSRGVSHLLGRQADGCAVATRPISLRGER